jgi:hypothetical protein
MPYNSVLLLAKKHSRSVFSACIPIAGGNCRSAVHFLTKHRGSLVSEGFGGDPWPLILLTLCLVFILAVTSQWLVLDHLIRAPRLTRLLCSVR